VLGFGFGGKIFWVLGVGLGLDVGVGVSVKPTVQPKPTRFWDNRYLELFIGFQSSVLLTIFQTK